MEHQLGPRQLIFYFLQITEGENEVIVVIKRTRDGKSGWFRFGQLLPGILRTNTEMQRKGNLTGLFYLCHRITMLT